MSLRAEVRPCGLTQSLAAGQVAVQCLGMDVQGTVELLAVTLTTVLQVAQEVTKPQAEGCLGVPELVGCEGVTRENQVGVCVGVMQSGSLVPTFSSVVHHFTHAWSPLPVGWETGTWTGQKAWGKGTSSDVLPLSMASSVCHWQVISPPKDWLGNNELR